jgi:hypothetical protein
VATGNLKVDTLTDRMEAMMWRQTLGLLLEKLQAVLVQSHRQHSAPSP